MKRTILFLLTFIFIGTFLGTEAVAQDENETPTPEELAEKQAEKLEKLLKLEDWQMFYVDSTLRHDYAAMDAEMAEYQRTRTTNADIYIAIQDKYMEKIDAKYKEIFTPEQWEKYLKNGAAKQQRERMRRKEKAEKAAQRILEK
jgi:hypothetical protein